MKKLIWPFQNPKPFFIFFSKDLIENLIILPLDYDFFGGFFNDDFAVYFFSEF